MKIQHINPDGLLDNDIFSQAVVLSEGKLVFTSGQVAWDDKGQLIGKDDFRQQTLACLNHISTILKSLDANWTHVIKLTSYIPQFDGDYHRSVFVEVLSQFTDNNHLPASTLLGIQSLAFPDLLIEIEAIIAIDD